MQRPVVEKLWVAGRASEDRQEWAEEVRAHCERCYDDKDETLEVQAERTREQRCRGDSLVAPRGRRAGMTIDRVLRARGKLKNKANGPSDCMVTEMLQNLSMESVCEITLWFEKRFSRESTEPIGLESLTSGISKKQTPDEKKACVGSLSVLSMWYTSVLVGLLHEEKEPIEWRRLHRRRERCQMCEHMQALLTNILQSHREWQEDRRTHLEAGFFSFRPAVMASLDVKTAFDVARPCGINVLSLTRVQDVRGSACSESSEYSAGGGGSSVVGTRGQISVVESRGEVEDHGVGTCSRREIRRRVFIYSEVRCGQTIIGYSVTTKRSWCAW